MPWGSLCLSGEERKREVGRVRSELVPSPRPSLSLCVVSTAAADTATASAAAAAAVNCSATPNEVRQQSSIHRPTAEPAAAAPSCPAYSSSPASDLDPSTARPTRPASESSHLPARTSHPPVHYRALEKSASRHLTPRIPALLGLPRPRGRQ